MITRRARPSDAAAISRLIDHWVPSGKLLARSEDFVAMHADDFVVALDDVDGSQRLVGCAHLEEYAPSLAELRSLAVDPDHHRGGIGSALVAAVEQLARLRGFPTLFAVSNNGPFFERRGYTARDIPELDRERSEVSRFKGVYAKDLMTQGPPSGGP